MEYERSLFEKGKQNDDTNTLYTFRDIEDAIEQAKRLTKEYANKSEPHHYVIMFHGYIEWEN
jgi:hypothetical protein